MTRLVNVSEAKVQLSRLIEEVQRGTRVVIGNARRPVAALIAYDHDPEPRALGAWRGKVWIADDFDDPLPPDVQSQLEGGA